MPASVAIPDSVVALLQRTVSFNTVNSIIGGTPNAEGALTDYLEQITSVMGFRTRRIPVPGGGDNLLVTFETEASRPWLMFMSHLDTVSIDGMTIDPLAAKIEGNRIWGRGSCDTKGTGAAMLWALREYAALPDEQRPNNIALAFTLDEEYGMTGVRAMVAHWKSLGFTPVGVIVGEPTRFRPVVAHNGGVRWSITTHGVAAHSADPSKGRSAISDMVRVIDAIESRYIPTLDARHPLTGKAQSSINLIHGGTQINILPARCEIRVDRRTVPGEDGTAVLPAVQRILDDVVSQRPGMRVEQQSFMQFPPLDDRINRSLLPIVQRALAQHNLPTDAAGDPYCTEAGDLCAAGIPAIVIGPGSIAQAHTKDEFLDVDQLDIGVKFYGSLMRGPLA